MKKLDRENVTYDYVDVTQHSAALARLREAGISTTPAAETPTELFPATNIEKLNAAVEQVRSQEPTPASPTVSPETGPSQ